MQSMTGYASQSILLETENKNKIKIAISLKTLNSRYFDITCKLPYIFSQYETEFIRQIKSKIRRGHAYLTIHMDDQNAFKTSIEPSMSTISGYINAANQIKDKLNIPGTISINDVIRLPNIFILEDKGIDQNTKNNIFIAIENIINALLIERNKEGNSIKNDIIQRLSTMQKNIELISDLFENSIEEQKEKISKKIQEINQVNNDVSEIQRQTLYLTLDKMDIHEEISRFKSHLNNINNLINSKLIEQGKQLDFILQELFREINTITAKTSAAQIIDLAITTKVEIEKIREQSQNIV